MVFFIPNSFRLLRPFSQTPKRRNRGTSLDFHDDALVLLLLKSAEANWWNQKWVMKYAELAGATFHPTDVQLHQLQMPVLDQVAPGSNTFRHHKFISQKGDLVDSERAANCLLSFHFACQTSKAIISVSYLDSMSKHKHNLEKCVVVVFFLILRGIRELNRHFSTNSLIFFLARLLHKWLLTKHLTACNNFFSSAISYFYPPTNWIYSSSMVANPGTKHQHMTWPLKHRGWFWRLWTVSKLSPAFLFFLAYTDASPNADYWGSSVTFPLSSALIRRSVSRADLDFCCRRRSYTGCHGSLTQFLKVRVRFPECIPAAGSSGGHPGILHLRRGRVGS